MTGTNTRALADQLKAGGIDYEFKEIPGLNHGGIIAGSMPPVFNFYGKHTKPQSK
jgi:dipeptidyl aminopeptidase/acylaminoacyl peptidase